MNKLICGIAALVLIALVTGCPGPTVATTVPEETTYVLGGTVSADIAGVDYTQVSVQLIQNGNPMSAVNPSANGSFEISGVPAGDGFKVRASLDGFMTAETETFSVPRTGAGFELLLEKITQATAAISGFITVDKAGVDNTSIDVILYYKGSEQRRIHPTTYVSIITYTFSGIAQKTSADYKVAAVLEGFDTVESQPFALTDNYTVPTLALKEVILPEITDCDFVEANKLIVTFSEPVEVINLDGFEFDADFSSLSITSHQMNGDYELELTMNRSIHALENIDVHYDSTKRSIKQKGTERYLRNYSDWAKKSFVIDTPLTATSFSFGGAGMPATALSIVWSKNIDTESFKTMTGWSISSDGGAIGFQTLMLNKDRMAMIILTRAPATGEVVTISYDAAVGSIKAAEGNAKLASFTTQITIE